MDVRQLAHEETIFKSDIGPSVSEIDILIARPDRPVMLTGGEDDRRPTNPRLIDNGLVDRHVVRLTLRARVGDDAGDMVVVMVVVVLAVVVVVVEVTAAREVSSSATMLSDTPGIGRDGYHVVVRHRWE